MKTHTPNQTDVDSLFVPFALVYLVIPNLIFLATWVRPWIGMSAAIVVIICLAISLRNNQAAELRLGLGRMNLTFVLLLAFGITLLAGVGGFLPQTDDYIKHNLLFHDLVQKSWPVKYDAGAANGYLCYGLGYYLVPALGGRVLGETLVPLITFLWTWAGVTLVFYWLATFDKSPKRTLIVFLLFSATETIWHLFRHVIQVTSLIGINDLTARLFHLGLYVDYQNQFIGLQFRPQHTLVGWIGTALLYEIIWVKKNPHSAIFVWSMCLLWSPITSIGLLLIPLAAVKRVRFRDYFEPVNLIGGGILLALMGIYFAGHVALADNGPIWKFSSSGDWLVFYPLFLVCLLSPILLIYLVDRKYNLLGELRPLFLVSAIFLLLQPLYKFGFFNDFRLETSPVVFMSAALAVCRCLRKDILDLKHPLIVLLIGSQIFGAAYPIGHSLWLNAKHGRNIYSFAHIQQNQGFNNLNDLKASGFDFDVASQYIGQRCSPAARWLLR
jgi:hypothetical protein